MFLEDHDGAAFFGGHIQHGTAVEEYIAGRRKQQPGDHAQRGGLAAARRAEKGHHLAGVDLQVNLVYRDHAGKAAGEIFEYNSRHKISILHPPKAAHHR